MRVAAPTPSLDGAVAHRGGLAVGRHGGEGGAGGRRGGADAEFIAELDDGRQPGPLRPLLRQDEFGQGGGGPLAAARGGGATAAPAAGGKREEGGGCGEAGEDGNRCPDFSAHGRSIPNGCVRPGWRRAVCNHPKRMSL